MHDGIEVEKQGLPAAVVCTDQFVRPARAMAQVCGLPDYPLAVVGHPMGSATPQERLEKARAALPQVVQILTRR